MATRSDIDRTKRLLEGISGSLTETSSDDGSLILQILDAVLDEEAATADQQILITQVERALRDKD